MAVQYLLTDLEAHHRVAMLDNLHTFKNSKLFTDVTLIVEGNVFKAHKIILASCSHYFSSMFADEMIEARENVAHITGVTATGLATLIEYMYTSELILSDLNVQDVLATAVYTQVCPVVKACTEFLKTNLDFENCTDVAIIADTYSLTELKEEVSEFIARSFLEIAKTKDFNRLSPDQVQYVVERDMPIDVTELNFLRLVLLWFLEGNEAEVNSKTMHAKDILRQIRFFEIIPSQLERMLDEVFAEKKVTKSGSELYETIMKISNLPGNLLKLRLVKNSFNTRGMKPALIKVGGFGLNGLTNDITFSHMNERHWRKLSVIPHVEQCNYGTAVANNELYVVGGCFNQALQEVIHQFGFKYQPRNNTWVKIRSMLSERCRFTLTELNNRLYAVAGATETGNGFELEATRTAECYDVEDGVWSYIESLPECRQQHAAASFSHLGASMLFISGGLHKDRVIASMFMYNTKTDLWTSCAPLLTPRADHFMICYNYKLYVCGGWREDPMHPQLRIQVPTIDAFDVVTNSWSFVTVVPTPRYHTGVVAHGSRIYFIGGFHNDAMFHKDPAAVECYDIATDTWTKGDKSPQDIWEHSCAMLYVPTHRSE